MAKTVLPKNKTVAVQTKNGRSYSFAFTTLAQIHEHLEETGQRYYAYVESSPSGADHIMIQKLDSEGAKLGEPIRGARIGSADNAQEYGGNLTSARRFSLLMAYGLACDDTPAPALQGTRSGAERQNGLDFEKIKDWLLTMRTVEEVERARASFFERHAKLTPKQQAAIGRFFVERKDQIADPGATAAGVGWRPAKAFPAKEGEGAHNE